MNRNQSPRTRVMVALGVVALIAAGAGATWLRRQAGGQVIGLGIWDRVVPMMADHAKRHGVEFHGFTVTALEDPQLPGRLGRPKVALVLNAPEERTERFVEALRKLHTAGTTLVALDHRDWQGGLLGSGDLIANPEVQRYWRYTGEENYDRMMDYLAVHYLGAHRNVLPPVPSLEDGLYHPDAPAPFPKLADYLRWYDTRHAPDAPRVAYIVYSNAVILKETADIDAVIRAMEKRGFAVYTMFGSTETGLRQALTDIRPDLLMTHNHSQLGRPADGSAPIPAVLGVPYLKPTVAMESTIEEWLNRPEGLTALEVNKQVFINELEGTIEPLIVSAQQTAGESRVAAPIPERVEHFADRAKAWIALQRTPEAKKKLAVVYYNVELGGDSLAQGSASGMFLNGPESLIRFTAALKARGYSLTPPADARTLIARLGSEGRNYGPWAQDQIDTLARSGRAALVSLPDYRHWFETKLTAEMQRHVIETHGPPPGHLMVTAIHGNPEIVIPRIDLGPGVSLFPQPEKGARQDSRLVHDQTAPPSHQYLAFYFWLQKVYHPDAIVHFGTHGTLELLPHRAAGLGPDDYADALLGTIPNINPWIIENVAEATLARRRAYATLVDHLVPPLEAVKPGAPLAALQDDANRAKGLEGPVREAYRRRIGTAMRKLAFGLDLLPKVSPDSLPDDHALDELAERLEELSEEHVPKSLHVLGEPPSPPDRVKFIDAILGADFDAHLGGSVQAEEAIACISKPGADPARCVPSSAKGYLEAATKGLASALVLEKGLLKTPDEITNLLGALDGRYVPPGPGSDPIRNPAAIPTGRNMYALDPEQVPSAPAMEVAHTLVDETLATYRKAHDGAWPTKLAINLNGFETMHDTGVTEGEALTLLGVDPIRDARGLVTEVRLLPLDKLGRPRVDVLLAISGAYRDNFPSRIRLLDHAIRLAQEAPEEGNPLAADVRAETAALQAGGLSPGTAAAQARRRIFGTPPGQYATQILYLIPRSGAWTDRSEVARVYQENMRFAYGEDVWGEDDADAYAKALQGTEAVLHTWSSSTMSPLTNHHVYEYLGGLSMAVEANSGGKAPDALVLDARDSRHPRSRTLGEVLSTEEAARLLNPDWIKEMEKDAYAGAGHVSAYTENLFGWATTVPDSVAGRTFERVDELYRRDTEHLGTRQWLAEKNPDALLSITSTLLEGARRGYWKPGARLLAGLAEDFMKQVAQQGPPTGLMGGGNEDLTKFVRAAYQAPGSAIPRPVVQAYEARLAKSDAGRTSSGKALAASIATAAKADNSTTVEGVAMRPSTERRSTLESSTTVKIIASAAAGLVALGFLVAFRRRRPRPRARLEG